MTLVVLYAMLVGGVGALYGMAPTFADGTLTWDYAGYIARENAETERTRITQENETARAEALAETLRQWALAGASAAVLIVTAIQAGRTARHVATERRRERQILMLFAARFLPGPGDVRVETVGFGRRLVLRDYDNGVQYPPEVAAAALMQRGLLPAIDGEADYV
jgi:hypothetical protein